MQIDARRARLDEQAQGFGVGGTDEPVAELEPPHVRRPRPGKVNASMIDKREDELPRRPCHFSQPCARECSRRIYGSVTLLLLLLMLVLLELFNPSAELFILRL